MTQILLKLTKSYVALLLFSLITIPAFADDVQIVDGEDDIVVLNDVKYLIDREAKTAALTNGQSVSGQFTIPESFTFENVTYAVTAIIASACRDA